MKVSLVILLTVACVVAKHQRRQAEQQWHPGCGTTKYQQLVKRAAPASNKEDDVLEPYVIGGQDAKPGEFPWMVSVSERGGNPYCAGVLIDPNWVLTVAHCLYYQNTLKNAKKILVKLGEHRLNERSANEKEYRVAAIIIHDDYDPVNYYRHPNDIAMIRLTKSVRITDYIRPVCAPPADESFENKTCTISGWGYRAEGGAMSNTLQYVDLPIISNAECAPKFHPRPFYDIFVCAGYPEGGKDSCQGDSGGPLVYDNEGKFQLVGLTAWGRGCGRPGFPGVYIRVSKFLDWIETTRASNGRPGKGKPSGRI